MRCKPASLSGLGTAFEKVRIRRHRQIGEAFDTGEAFDERFEVAAHHRFAARHAQLIDTKTDEQFSQTNDLFVIENLSFWLPFHRLGRHAIEAAKIAAIRHRNAQVADGASKTVFEQDGQNHFLMPVFNVD